MACLFRDFFTNNFGITNSIGWFKMYLNWLHIDDELEQLAIKVGDDIPLSKYGYIVLKDGTVYCLTQLHVHDLVCYKILEREGRTPITESDVRNIGWTVNDIHMHSGVCDCSIHEPGDMEDLELPKTIFQKLKRILDVLGVEGEYSRVNGRKRYNALMLLQNTHEGWIEGNKF